MMHDLWRIMHVRGASIGRGAVAGRPAYPVEQVSTQVRQAITFSSFPPASGWSSTSLAADLGVSITPVREALRQLQREGLVSDVPYSGMQVAAPSPTELNELYTVLGVSRALPSAAPPTCSAQPPSKSSAAGSSFWPRPPNTVMCSRSAASMTAFTVRSSAARR